MRIRFQDLLLERNDLKVVATCRQIVELATVILGAICFLISVSSMLGLLTLPSSVWLLPTMVVLGTALLTFSFTSFYFRQEELSLDRRWRSHSLRCTDLIESLQNLLQLKYNKERRVRFRVNPLPILSNAQSVG
ncbi:hypothetical protein [Chlamydia avium]|nr:hypothetical protein [Chlamydia avium]EPP37334.1 hypothetical protein CP10743SC13_0729 [Chlamydia psittaci 10_743_SC13]EPP38450.1 hypothetical protein CP10881SC42_0809 [Chlamydia avium]